MTPEEPIAEKPKNPPGRPKMPVYNDMHPVYELYIRIRNRLRKTKPVTAPEVKGWLIEIALLQALGYEIRVREPEPPEPENIIKMLKTGESDVLKPVPQAMPTTSPLSGTISLGGDL